MCGETMSAHKCLPCKQDDHDKLLHARCDYPGCSFQVSFCYFSFLGPLQASRCPSHHAQGREMAYHLHGLPTGIPVSPGFHPAQERWCSCGCRGPVKFTSYCGICGWPEDLCARRMDLMRTPLHQGHNEFTHCTYCPNLASRVLIPATGSTAADWESYLQSHAGIHTLLAQADAAHATASVVRFMRMRSLHTWQQFLRHSSVRSSYQIAPLGRPFAPAQVPFPSRCRDCLA